ncbi:MAG: alpha/beta fold hydrolase [Chloroflexota bacterium]|nr:alpha/beta fold hydrolase [Chloroflexota bacterium]
MDNIIGIRIVRTVLLVAAAALLVVYVLISFMIARGVTQADRYSQEAHPIDYGLGYEDVEFHSRHGGLMLSGWYLPGHSGSPHIIFVHGMGSVRSGDHAVELASRLADFDFNVLMFDLRGHGSSNGDKVSGGYFERWDVLGAFDYLLERGVDPGRIGLMGFSMGAAASIFAATEEPRINAVAVDSIFANASDLIAREAARKTAIPGWLTPMFTPASKLMAKGIYGIDIGALIPERAVSKLDYPVMLIHGIADERVPWQQGQRVAAASKEGSSIWLVPRVKHLDAFLEHPEEYVRKVSAYFDRRFR